MSRRIALLVGMGVAVLVLCTACRGVAAGPIPTPAGGGQIAVTTPDNPVGSSNSDQLNSQLDNLQSSLNNIQAQLSADAAP